MNVIDDLKKLLAAATGVSWYAGELANGELVVFARREKDDRLADSILEAITPGGTSADVRLAALALPLAQALVKSQKALKRCESMISEEGWPDCTAATEARVALRLDGLAAAMKAARVS